jgi:transcription initiation factor TFIIIB Brf1 subunit/transcription initiation factor TFIIB
MDKIFKQLKQMTLLEPEKPVVCDHERVYCSSGVVTCSVCNEVLDELETVKSSNVYSDSNRYIIRKQTVKNVFQDMNYMDIDEQIKMIANDIYSEVCLNKVHRGFFRKGIILAAIIIAHNKLNRQQNPEELIKKFNVPKKNVLKGYKYIHDNIVNRDLLDVDDPTAFDFINEYSNKFCIDICIKNEIQKLYQKDREHFLRAKPQSIAGGFIYYYFITNKKPIELKTFADNIGLTSLTIHKIYKELVKINSVK